MRRKYRHVMGEVSMGRDEERRDVKALEGSGMKGEERCVCTNQSMGVWP